MCKLHGPSRSLTVTPVPASSFTKILLHVPEWVCLCRGSQLPQTSMNLYKPALRFLSNVLVTLAVCLCNWWEDWFYIYIYMSGNRLEEAAPGLDLHSVYWVIECSTVCRSRVLGLQSVVSILGGPELKLWISFYTCCRPTWQRQGKLSALYKPKPVSKRRDLRNCGRRILC